MTAENACKFSKERKFVKRTFHWIKSCEAVCTFCSRLLCFATTCSKNAIRLSVDLIFHPQSKMTSHISTIDNLRNHSADVTPTSSPTFDFESTESSPTDCMSETSWWHSFTSQMSSCTKESSKYLEQLRLKGKSLKSLSYYEEMSDLELLIKSLEIHQGLLKSHYYRITCVIQELSVSDRSVSNKWVEDFRTPPQSKRLMCNECADLKKQILHLEATIFEAENKLKTANSDILSCIATLSQSDNNFQTYNGEINLAEAKKHCNRIDTLHPSRLFKNCIKWEVLVEIFSLIVATKTS